jgi:hypothetical protein
VAQSLHAPFLSLVGKNSSHPKLSFKKNMSKPGALDSQGTAVA